tara:strand:- start:326 stop:598 length:273 start_codon:yes stop_codon:yes gene_type:complete
MAWRIRFNAFNLALFGRGARDSMKKQFQAGQLLKPTFDWLRHGGGTLAIVMSTHSPPDGRRDLKIRWVNGDIAGQIRWDWISEFEVVSGK